MNPYTTAPQSFRFWNILMPTVTTVVFVVIPSILWFHIFVTGEDGTTLSLVESTRIFITAVVLNILLTALHTYGNGLMNESHWDKLGRALDALDGVRTSRRRLGPSLTWIIITLIVASPPGLAISLSLVALTTLRAIILLMATISRFVWSCRPGAEEIMRA